MPLGKGLWGMLLERASTSPEDKFAVSEVSSRRKITLQELLSNVRSS